MLDRLRSLFVEDEQSNTLRTEVAAAALMFEVMWADQQIELSELDETKAHLVSIFNLDPESVDEIVQETKILHGDSVGLHPFTRAINETVSAEDKFRIVEALWRIALSDEQVDALEEHMIRKISDLLYVSHRDFIRAKLAARN